MLLIAHRDHEAACKELIRTKVGSDAFEAWFGSLRLVEVRRRAARFSVISHFLQRRILARYAEVLLEVVKAEWPQLDRFELRVRTCTLRVVTVPRVYLLPPPPRVLVFDSNKVLELPPRMVPGQMMRFIQRVVAHEYEISCKELISERRLGRLIEPRQVAMYLAREITKKSLPEVGRYFGGRDHSTILYACRKVEKRMKRDGEFRHKIERFKQVLARQEELAA